MNACEAVPQRSDLMVHQMLDLLRGEFQFGFAQNSLSADLCFGRRGSPSDDYNVVSRDRCFYEFVDAYREAIIAKTRVKVSTRPLPPASKAEEARKRAADFP